MADVNQDDQADLVDLILVLQTLTGAATTDTVYASGDVDGDWKIGISEAIYLLNKIRQ